MLSAWRVRAAAPVAVVALLTGALISGCAEANPSGLPEYRPGDAAAATAGPAAKPSRSPSATARRTAKPSPEVAFTPADALGQGAYVERGRIVATSATQRAVVAATISYLNVMVRTLNTWQVDEGALAAVATGQAVEATRDRAAYQREHDRRTVGRFVVNISEVRIDGDGATVTGCHFDATSEVDQDGNVMVTPPGGVRITMELRRTDGSWRVGTWPDRSVPTCDWRKS